MQRRLLALSAKNHLGRNPASAFIGNGAPGRAFHGRRGDVRDACSFVSSREKCPEQNKAVCNGSHCCFSERRQRVPGHRANRKRPETFAPPDFTHYCEWTRGGRLMMKCRPQRARRTGKLKALRSEAWRATHAPLTTQYRCSKRVRQAIVPTMVAAQYPRSKRFSAKCERSGYACSGHDVRRVAKCHGKHSLQ